MRRTETKSFTWSRR